MWHGLMIGGLGIGAWAALAWLAGRHLGRVGMAYPSVPEPVPAGAPRPCELDTFERCECGASRTGAACPHGYGCELEPWERCECGAYRSGVANDE
jgi:hypothetical protein